MKQSFLGHSSNSRNIKLAEISQFSINFALMKIYLTTPNEILKLLKEIDTKNTVGFDMIKLKLVKIATHD